MNDPELARARYFSAAKRMQSGVAQDQADEPESTKHLRVGVNSAMVEHSALLKLLLDKGIIAEHEYIEALASGMEREVKRYEELLSRRHGAKITLGEAGFGGGPT